MPWAVSNARVEPKGNAITITKQASGTPKIDPLMAAFNAIAWMSGTFPFVLTQHLHHLASPTGTRRAISSASPQG
jgi:phage terminase large subunit-like protein